VTIHTSATIYFVVPDGIDDDERISGGNLYDRRVRDGLRQRGWEVRMAPVAPGQPRAAIVDLSVLPDDAIVLVDGLIAATASDSLSAESTRLKIIVLVHMVGGATTQPGDGHSALRAWTALRSARRVITTSEWTRTELIAAGLADPAQIVVARPGTDASPRASHGSISGLHLVCVGAVAPHKGQDLLVDALAALRELDGWTCSIVGAVTTAPEYVAGLSAKIGAAELTNRVAVTGVRTGSRLNDVLETADLLVAPSRSESYGMAVTEALARGIPVVAARVGGLPEAVAENPAGILIPPDDPWALRVVLRQWMDDAGWRSALKAEATRERWATRDWADTVDIISATLSDVERSNSASAALEPDIRRFRALR
jgi:glycosyltransferase involved in cell wall biosynthesis